MDVKACRKNPKVKVNMVIEALSIDWSETFDNSQTISIPGFYYSGFGGVSLKVDVDSKRSGSLRLKVIVISRSRINGS